MNVVIAMTVLTIGGLLSLQSVLNARLAHYLVHPLQSSTTNFIVGSIFLILLNLFLKLPVPAASSLKEIPLYLFFGGIIGTVVVSSAVFLIPAVGISFFSFGIIVGQLTISTFMEHYGFLGLTVREFCWKKALAILLLTAGFVLMKVASKDQVAE